MADRSVDSWVKAMLRAFEKRCKARLIGPNLYSVASESETGEHLVFLAHGKIVRCTAAGDISRDCPGWSAGVCKHAGAVARRIIGRRAFGQMVKEYRARQVLALADKAAFRLETETVVQPERTRQTIYREEVAV